VENARKGFLEPRLPENAVGVDASLKDGSSDTDSAPARKTHDMCLYYYIPTDDTSAKPHTMMVGVFLGIQPLTLRNITSVTATSTKPSLSNLKFKGFLTNEAPRPT